MRPQSRPYVYMSFPRPRTASKNSTAHRRRLLPSAAQVPGGVGPMTIAMLLKNTVNLARHSVGLPALA